MRGNGGGARGVRGNWGCVLGLSEGICVGGSGNGGVRGNWAGFGGKWGGFGGSEVIGGVR